jgi:hypothetical protein
MQSSGSKGMSFFCATTMELLSTIVVTNQGPKSSNVGGSGLAASGRSKSRGQMASGLASQNNDRYSSIADNIFVLGTANSVVRVRLSLTPSVNWPAF